MNNDRVKRRWWPRATRAAAPAVLVTICTAVGVGRGSAPPILASPAPQPASPSTGAWQAPLCGPQPHISAVFDHEHPSYGCPPNGNPRCDGHNGVLRLYNNTVDDRRLYEGHNGWDYRTRGEDWRNRKRAVHAVADGIVRFAGWHAPGYPDDPQCSAQVEDHALGYGLMVLVDHGGEESLYGHLSAVDVRPGQSVRRGQRLGASGATGNAAGPHLHLGAFRPDGPGLWHAFDPYGWNEDWRGTGSRPLPPELDPWFAVGGPRSKRRLVPGAPSAPACARTCGPDTVIDDADPGFSLGCDSPPCRWRHAAGGWEGGLRHVAPAGALPDHWARWQAPLPPGRYAVAAFLPAWRRGSPAHAVPYLVGASAGAVGGGQPTTIVDQHAEGNVWLPLGTFDFPTAPTVWLRNGSYLPDNWAYRGPCRAVLADAVRFTPLCTSRSSLPGAAAATIDGCGTTAQGERATLGGLPEGAQPTIALPPPLQGAASPSAAYPPPPSPAYPPPPSTATPTVAPPGPTDPRPTPPGIPHLIVPAKDALREIGLVPLVHALAQREATGLARLIDGRLALDPPWATEGWGIRMDRSTTTSLLEATLPPAGAPPPKIQGFFGADCWPRRRPTCEVQLVITGLSTGVSMPPRATAETTGPLPPTTLPAIAAWHVLPDTDGGLWWRSWHPATPGEGYRGLLEDMVAAGWGTYHVLR